MRYAILTTPRTGGRALCDCLAQTGVAGMVGKDGGVRGNELYIGAGEALAQIDIKQAVDDFFAANRTPNGVEGVKINFPYLLTLQKWVGWEPVEAIIQSLDYAVVLKRKDRIAQAVSLYFAQKTGRWSEQVGHPPGTGGICEAPEYDYNEIVSRIARNMMGESWIDEMVTYLRIRARWFVYEELDDFYNVPWAILKDLNVDHLLAAIDKPRLQRQIEPRKDEFIERFKQEYSSDPSLV